MRTVLKKSFAARCAVLGVAALLTAGVQAEQTLTPSGDTTGATDYTAITEAVAQGGTVELGEGTFYVNHQIELTGAVTLKGAGLGKTTICPGSSKKIRLFHLNCKDAVVSGLKITGGSLDTHGGGVWIDSAGGSLVECRVTGNNVGMNCQAAGIYMTGADGRVIRCISDHNTDGNNWAQGGNGIYLTAGRVENCLFYGNTCAGDGRGKPAVGVIASKGGTVVNCTIAGNTGLSGGISASGSAKIINCIVFGNSKATGDVEWMGTQSCYENCLFGDPTFKNAAANDYHISCAGAAVDKGTGEETFNSNTDLDGKARVVNGKCDLGCYENQGFDDWIDITAVPEEYGTVAPAYGQTDGLAADGKLPVSAPSSIQIGTDMATCIGWKLYDAEGTQVGEGEDCAFTYEHQGVCRKLVWQWKPSFGVTVSAAEGGTVQASAAAAGYGEVVTITATPDPSLAGVSFWKWEGDVPAENIYDNPLELTVDAAKSVRAIFGTAHAYVASAESPSATPAFPYGSPATAANTLKDAFAVTADNGVIECGEGTFAPGDSFTVDRPVTIRGAGYDKATLNLNGKHLTVSSSNARIEGFKVTGAKIEWNATGGGIIVTAGTVANCRFTGNVDNNGINAKGLCAGVSGSGRITHCIFDNNDVAKNGKNTIGVLGIAGGTVDNCLIVSNKCQQGGGVYMNGGVMRNCTITANEATTGKGGGVFTGDNSTPTIVNCIIYGNKAKSGGDAYQFGYNSGTSRCDHNCCGEGVALGTNPVDGNPSFGEGCRLNPGSAGINQGAAYDGMLEDTDLGGDPRVVGDIVDLGCYEYVPSTVFTCTISANAWSALVGGSVQLSADFDEETFDPADYAFTWTVTGDDESEATVESVQKPSVTLPNPTEYTIAVAVTDKDGQAVFACTADRKVKVLPATVYLAEENDGCEFPYDTEATAATNLAELVSILVDGVTVVALPGTHLTDRTIEIEKEITIRGKEGWDRTTIRQTKYASKSTQCRVFVLNNAKAVLQGLTIRGGYAYSVHGAGVCIAALGGTVADCRITGNTTSMNAGGAVRLESANAKLLRSIVDNNANGDGNGNCPGVSMDNGIVESCLIYSNVVQSCVSRAYSVSGGVSMGGGTLRNCTVTANRGRGVGGVECSGWQMVNCVVFGNTATTNYWVEGTSPEFQTNALNSLVSCRFADPQFVDAENLDFHLQKGSPAINVGTYGTWMDAATDLDGNPRAKHVKRYRSTGEVKRAYVDLGCYETEWRGPGFVLWVR